MEKIPEWFLVVTTFGMVVIIAMLWLNYTAISSLSRANYALMQSNSDMNLIDSGMMRMMAVSMMRNNLTTREDFEKIDKAYNSSASINEAMEKMMKDNLLEADELFEVTENHVDMRKMMERMMR
ncbi:hypothetical protein HY988_07490 [Candidatus Micrarchaeota archaeon]|nr:hypothetical protein [Candidatus Micrarchaeota archaeon]